MALRRKYIRSLVESLLRKQNIHSAPVDVEKLALASGVIVRYEPAEDSLCGFLLRDPTQQKVIIGVNKNHPDNRKRFTIGHELGHFLLHESAKFHVDYKFRLKISDDEFQKGDSTEEKEANLFAAELLMPASFIKQDLEQINRPDLFEALDIFEDEKLQSLAKHYQVSVQALTFRLAYLNYIRL